MHRAQGLCAVLGVSQGRAGDRQKLKQRQEGAVVGNCKTGYLGFLNEPREDIIVMGAVHWKSGPSQLEGKGGKEISN